MNLPPRASKEGLGSTVPFFPPQRGSQCCDLWAPHKPFPVPTGGLEHTQSCTAMGRAVHSAASKHLHPSTSPWDGQQRGFRAAPTQGQGWDTGHKCHQCHRDGPGAGQGWDQDLMGEKKTQIPYGCTYSELQVGTPASQPGESRGASLVLMRAQVGSCSSSIPWAHRGVKQPSQEQHSALHLHTKRLETCTATSTLHSPLGSSVPWFSICEMGTAGQCCGAAGSSRGPPGGQQSLVAPVCRCVHVALSIRMHFTYRCMFHTCMLAPRGALPGASPCRASSSSVLLTPFPCTGVQAVLRALQPFGDPQWDLPVLFPQQGQMPRGSRNPRNEQKLYSSSFETRI